MPRMSVRPPALLAFLVLLSSLSVRAQPIDDFCHFPWWQMEWNVALMGPIGQEFIATRDRMNFVDLMLAESGSQPGTVDVAVRVRAQELGGTIVGESRVSTLPDGFSDVKRLFFDAPVPLIAGELYVLEVVRSSTQGTAMVRGANEDPCANRRAYILGQPSDFSDLFYQVGWDAALALQRSSWSALKSRY